MIKREYKIEKFPGKGGWYFVQIPEIKQDGKTPFGWKTISGSIDGIPFEYKKLMPMGNGKLFFSINAQLRKQLKNKSEGDSVLITINDNPILEITEEIVESIRLVNPKLIRKLNALSNDSKIKWIHPIYCATSDVKKVEAINKLIDFLVNYHN